MTATMVRTGADTSLSTYSVYGKSAITRHLRLSESKKDTAGSPSSSQGLTYARHASFDEKQILVKSNARNSKPSRGFSVIISRWEGIIVDVLEATFIVQLTRVDQPLDDIVEAEFSFADVSLGDRKFIAEGVLIYFSVYRETALSGRVTVGNNIMVRRLPAWKDFDLNEETDQVNDEHSSTTLKVAKVR